MKRVGQGMLLLAISQVGEGTWAGTQLPVPCAGGACGSRAPSFVTSGAATAAQSGKSLTVNQSSNAAILNWSSFNISADGKVTFKQPSTGAIALNRIFDANPSSIFGSLNANGQIYLINANGFLFGSTSTVNVAGLLASSLNITDKTFSSGILAPVLSNKAALEPFTGDSLNFADDAGTPVANTGVIAVQSGAQLTAAEGGRLLLAAPTVQNAGTLTAPGGQIALAAGQTIFLQASDDPALRGLIVEVNGVGSASNLTSGTLTTPRGNITLTGLMVNQEGRISATTTVSANGSVRLEAGNNVKFNGTNPITAQQGGRLDLGPGSRIDILPELTDTATAVDAQTQLQSAVTLVGEQVLMRDTSVVAPNGLLTVTASADPDKNVTSGVNSQARIRIDAGTAIDLSGSHAELPVAANLVTVQLRSNELKDDPAQRNGALRGTTVTVDARADGGLGTSIADVTSAIAAVGKNVAQRTEAGGTAKFLSEGDVVFASGASLNVSGGWTTYDGGNVQTTQLMGANGRLYDIGTANPLQAYSGIVNPNFTQIYDKWGVKEVLPTPGLSHYEAGYLQGAQAGAVQFAAPSLLLGGSLSAAARNGQHQRGPLAPAGAPVPFGDAVSGGTLTIGLPTGAGGGGNTLGQKDYLAPAVVVSAHPTPVAVADDAALPPQTLQLPLDILTSDGFTNTNIYSNTTFSLPAGLPVQLPAGESLQVSAPRVDIDSNIAAPGGSLQFTSVLSTAEQNPTGLPTLGPGFARAGLGVGSGVTLDVSGQWTNDGLFAGGVKSVPTWQNGGSISFTLTQPAGELVLGNGVALEADGGAWLQASGALAYGRGGAITLDASPSQSALQFGQNLGVEAFGAGTAAGGSLALTAPRIDIAQGSGSAWTRAQRVDELTVPGSVLHLYAPLFSQEGFSSVSLTATGAVISAATDDVLSVLSGTTIAPQAGSQQLNTGYQMVASGGTLADFSHTAVLPDYLRQPTNVSLNVLRLADDLFLGSTAYGVLDVQQGAAILADPGASISLRGEGSLTVAGTLRAPGGTVNLQLLSPAIFNPDTASRFDPGYVPDLGITVASTAIIDVAGGAPVYTPNNQGLLKGTLRPGGSVSINAERGTVSVDSGSVIDFSGTSATLDVPSAGSAAGVTREMVGTAGGSLTLASVESIELLGSLRGKAGVGGGGNAAAGSLEVDLTRSESILGQPDPFGLPMEIDLVGSTATSIPAPRVNLATLGVSEIENSGVDSLTLRAGGTELGNVSINTALPLTLGRQVILDSRSLTVTGGLSASIAAPFVEVGNSITQGSAGLAPVPTAGTGKLAVNAQQMTLLGNWALQGTSLAAFTSQGDVQLQGTALQSGPETGSLVTAGNLTINAARVYPDTYTNFSLQALGNGDPRSGTVTIGQTVASPGSPLSAGGSVSISANDIVIGGTLLAPFGHIDLAANDTLTLAKGSLVSVSGAGLDVPFGQTENGARDWIYTTQNGGPTTISGTPGKQVSLTAPNMLVQSGATVDLRGGGDLYAYEWVPGTGGSHDRLSSSATKGGISGLYAILPSAPGLAAPFDPQESGGAVANQTVYLSGGAGLAAGYYALLPPRYALQPGAVLIQLESQYVSAGGGQIGALADGTPVIAGYLSSGTTGLHLGSTAYQGFAVYPGAYGRQLANYSISDASSFFSGQAAKADSGPVAGPADAGSLTFSVLQSLNNSFSLQGKVLAAAAPGGSGATVNISAPELEITAGDQAATAGSIAVSGSVLQSWNAGQLILGGRALGGTAATVADDSAPDAYVQVTAGKVTVDAGVALSADQILVVAQLGIDVKSGASLSSTSGKAGTPLKTLPAEETLGLTNSSTLTDAANSPLLPDAALLAVSDLALPVVARSGTLTGAIITMEPGSTVQSGGALAVDAPGSVLLSGALNGKGASWSLSSGSVGFLGAAGSSDSLNIDSGLLTSLQQAGAVRIASQGAIDVYAPVTLGAAAAGAEPTLNTLTLLGTTLANQAAGDSVFGARTLTLGGVNTAPAATGAGSGNLTFVADTLTVGPNSMAIRGFGSTTAQVAGSIGSAGAGGLDVAGDLTLNAVELAPGAGSQTSLSASGVLTLGTPTTLRAGTSLPTAVGGALALSGSSIVDAGVIAAPSGVVSLTAGGGDLTLRPTAAIITAGTLLQAANRSAASPGGAISLKASGDVTIASGSHLDVSGEQLAPAGSVDIVSGGAATLAGTLRGSAGAGGSGGRFSLDAGSLNGGLSPLAASLMSGSFSDSVALRVRSGDLDLTAGSGLTAHTIGLTADAGVVNIAGVLSASSGARRGRIDLSGGTGVTLAAGGELHADATGSAGLGGEIDLNSTCAACSITLNTGSVVSAAGAGHMGQLVLRAPAVGGDEVAINIGQQGLGANVSRVGQVIVEPVTTFATSGATVDADLAADVGLASAYLTAASPVIAARLIAAGATPVAVHAGVELQDTNAADALTLHSFDLSSYSAPYANGLGQTPQVIDLSVRAAGSLSIQGAISDGFINDFDSGLIALSYGQNGLAPSGSLSFVAGADLQSANRLSVLNGSSANLTLLTSAQRADGTTDGIGPSVVRTGTGNIDLAAAGNVVFQAGTSAYTGGTAPTNVPVPNPLEGSSGTLLQNFGVNGGSVRIIAANDVVGSPVGVGYTPYSTSGNLSVAGWLARQGNAQSPAQYGVNFAAFDWNVGALEGGDVLVTAGHDVVNLSAAAADSLASVSTLDGKPVTYGAGGGLAIRAGNDIGSAQVYVADGVGSLIAGGGLTAVRTPATSQLPVGSAIALGNSQVAVWARQAVQVDAIYNPTFVPQTSSLGSLGGKYFTYGAGSGVSLSSSAGDVTLDLNTGNGTMATLVGGEILAAGTADFRMLPANLSMRSLQHDLNVNVSGSGLLYPDSNGQLSLFAGRDIVASGGFTMADNQPLSYPTAANPGIVTGTQHFAVDGLIPFDGAIHADDPNPALVTAGRDISNLYLSVPKATRLVAGRDVVNLQFSGQNAAPTDTTLIVAGRDLLDQASSSGNSGRVQLGGPGSLDILSGRNLDLGFSVGITTVGNLANANLPTAQGADVSVMVGYGTKGADLGNFLSSIVDKSPGYQAQLVSYVDTLTGNTTLTYPQAETQFRTLTTNQQSALIDDIFFNELLLSGRAANSGAGVGFAQGYAAIDALYPGSRAAASSAPSPYAGDLTLTSSQIYTLSGGDISLMVPGGKLDVGLANPPTTIAAKAPSLLGIVAQGAGNVSIYTRDDVNVNQSRIFTLGGGNVLIWSNEGSIDAGNGSKSSLSVPPPVVLIKSDGTISLDFAGSLASGSGIRTIQTSPSVPPGNVDLDAPVGTVNAGDAGIGASGNINIAAAKVIGIDNINFGGTATGVPADVSNLGAALSGVSAVASSATSSAEASVAGQGNAAKDVAPLAQTALSWLDVFVTGLGEDNCKPNDVECLKRQKTASP